MRPKTTSKTPEQKWPDWRGWFTLLWVIWCGWAYAVMAVHARGPQVLEWLRALSVVGRR